MCQKLIALGFFTVGMYLFHACCQDYKPYFDYSFLLVLEVEDNRSPAFDTMTVFQVVPEGLSYFAGATPSGPINTALAMSCPDWGEDGPKYPLSSIAITCAQDFNDTLPAGTLLNALFYTCIFTPSGPTWQTFSDSVGRVDFASLYDYRYIGTPHKPKDLAGAYNFTIKMMKSDSSVAEGTIRSVFFQ